MLKYTSQHQLLSGTTQLKVNSVRLRIKTSPKITVIQRDQHGAN